MSDNMAKAVPKATPAALRTSCDAPEGKYDATARRNDAFAALAATARIDLGSVYSGEWVGNWRSRMPFARIFFVLASGPETGFLSDSDARIPLRPNTWIFLPPGREIVHDQRPGLNVVSIHFRITLRGRPNPFFGRPMRGGSTHELKPVFSAIAGMDAASGGLDRLPTVFLAQGAVWTILGHVAEAEGPALAAGLERGAAFARLFEAVDNAPEGNFSVAEMAKFVYLGESAFTKRFHAEMGVSPRTWFNDRRARAAAEALLEPGATVAGVAERFGFGNEFYFSRFFRRHFGLPPSQWRNQCHI